MLLRGCDVAAAVAKRQWACGFRCIYFLEAQITGKTSAPPDDENQTPRRVHMAPHTYLMEHLQGKHWNTPALYKLS